VIKLRTLLAMLATATIVLASCASARSTDYKTKTTDYRTTNYKKAAEKLVTDAKGRGSTATCENPSSVSVGTTFICSGTDEAGITYHLVAIIDQENHIIVAEPDSRVPDEAPPAAPYRWSLAHGHNHRTSSVPIATLPASESTSTTTD
jgi:hypothetical protein